MYFCTAEKFHARNQHRQGPDLHRHLPVAGHGRRHRDSEEGETGKSEDNVPLASDSHEHNQPLKSNNDAKGVSDIVMERHGCTDGKMSTNKRSEDRMRGDGSNMLNCRKDTHPQAKTEVKEEEDCVEHDREQQGPAGAAKPTKKARKPDREFYQPGSRRNVQGKDSGVGSEQDKPPPRRHDQKIEPESQWSTEEKEGKHKVCIQKPGGKDKEVKGNQEKVKLAKSSETNRKQGSRDVEKPPLPSDATMEKLTNKAEKLCIKEKGKVGGEGQYGDEASGKKVEAIDKGRREQAAGTKEVEEKVEKKRERGNRRRRGGEREKERNQDSRKGEGDLGGEGGGEGKSDQAKAEKERKSGRTGEMHQSKGRENRRENRRGDNNNNNQYRDSEKETRTQRNGDRAVERSDRYKASPNITTPTSKRYSKSDIRRPRNRTYSSSSASSVTSMDGPGLGMTVENSKWPHLEPRHNNREGKAISGEGRRSHLQSWTTNGESSTESREESEMSDIAEDRSKKYREIGRSAAVRREEMQRPKGNKVGGRGILRVSLEKQAGTLSNSGDAHHRKQGPVPRGRGGGILVLPARTDISNSPEVGQRMLFGGIRGGAACRSRGGRGGGVRRLWDPNNPDQKPALARTQSSQHPTLQQPVYLQTGAGYGQLHFLDTDDEVSSSPPVPQGEHFRSQQQAAAIAYYKFQNSDNPYCYPMPASNQQNPCTNTSQRYPYPYVEPYQIANGVYPGPGVGQFCGGYRGAGYSAGVTSEEVEQQARGELGRLLRAADAQELQLSNLLSRDRVSADGLDRMAKLR